MSWYTIKTKRVNLPEPYDMFWIEVIKAESLSGRVIRELESLQDKVSINTIESAYSKLIVNWNITDPDTGEPLKSPREDPEELYKLPMEVINLIGQTALGSITSMDPTNAS